MSNSKKEIQKFRFHLVGYAIGQVISETDKIITLKLTVDLFVLGHQFFAGEYVELPKKELENLKFF